MERSWSSKVGAKMPQRRAQQTLSANPPQVTHDLNECWSSSMIFLDALLNFCGTSTQMAEKFVRVFRNTIYCDSAVQFQSATRDLYAATTSVSSQLKSKLDGWFMGIMTRDEDHSHVLAKCYLNLIQLHCQFVVTSTDVLAQFCNYSTIEDMQSQSKPEAEELASYAFGAEASAAVPEVNVTDMDDVAVQTFAAEEDEAVPIYLSDGQPSPYGDIGSKVTRPQGQSQGQSQDQGQSQSQSHSPAKVTRSLPASPVKQESRRAIDLVSGCQGEVVTENELDNVINFLSSTRLQSVFPVPARPYSAALTSTSTTVSSSSDSHSASSSLGQSMTSSSSSGSDGLGGGRTSLSHRLSDGAIEAMREASNTWPSISDPITSQAETMYGSSTSLGSDPEFLNYVQSVGVLIGQPSPVWVPPWQKSNRSWPVKKQPIAGFAQRHHLSRIIRHAESSSSDGSVDENVYNMGVEYNVDRSPRLLAQLESNQSSYTRHPRPPPWPPHS